MELPLKNKYWILRHGRSIPNDLDIVVSSLDNGILPEHGLTALGIQQAKAAAKIFAEEVTESCPDGVAIYSSPFSRTIQTSECVIELLAADAKHGSLQLHIMEELRERYFGSQYELQSRFQYCHDDTVDPFVGPEGGESVMEVGERVMTAISKVEAELRGYAVLFVSHGDVLQILQAAVEAIQTCSEDYPHFVAAHKRYELCNAELRRLA